jgi:hypothetical protein
MAVRNQRMRRAYARVAMVAIVGGLFAVRLCYPAATVTDPDVCIRDVPDPGASNESHPDVVFNGLENRYLVVYEDDVNGNPDVFGIYVSDNGRETGIPFPIATQVTLEERRPVAANRPGTNEYLVVWQSRLPGGTFDIYGRIVAGATLGPVLPIAASSGDQKEPDVAHVLGQDRYVIVWEDHDTSLANPPDIMARVLDGDGTYVLGLSAGVFPGSQTAPALATASWSSELLVTWTDSRGTPNGIFGRRIDTAGSPSVGSMVAITDNALEPGRTAVAWGVSSNDVPDPGRFLVVWPDGNLIQSRRVSAMDYSLVGTVTTVSDFASVKYNPELVFNRSILEWWVAWQDNRDCG